ncbi:hypothetical protein [Ligilactobacillus apodemi]|uniref:Uncharacterized protein n=1 Tax=Ligilactobacillus apodemi DSM 16634 = JCM 16172 TaxID=1423724 RepID=A0A0R1TRD0_9LACO|nr:hypothetical protein [Ligilactobacillus apodemi]KRL83981.1 hypothetical protein FC32_GL001252 [Ligilactobacillus apodemi DSM 16634 = JCM 16172]
MAIYYMYDAVTKEYIGEVQAPNQPEYSTELPPTRTLNNEVYHLANPKWDGIKWTGDNKDLDLLKAIEDLSIQVAQNTELLLALTGGDEEDV